ncbi:MAG: flavodoxin family protein [Planctomycetota bacterium]|jgi:multimeric flavodoxin WrbA
MKVLGISGSPRKDATTEQLVREVLNTVECESELISLAGKRISACIACLGCVEDNVCVLKDDMQELREKIVSADAYVIGGANYFSMLNGLAHCFLERWYQFRHRESKIVAGKLGVAVGVGGGTGELAAENIKKFFEYNQIECVGSVWGQGRACCFTCGYGETCRVGAIHILFGEGTKITPEITPDLSKQPDVLARAHELGKLLSDRLNDYARAT